jgi:hypothetical protein
LIVEILTVLWSNLCQILGNKAGEQTMYLINRAAAVVKLKQPYLDWTHSFGEEHKITLEDINRENHIYLLPHYDTDEELAQIIKDLYPHIFEVELWSWHSDDSLWPEIKYQTFLDWFEVQVHSMVLDPYEDEIEKEEFFGG